MRTKRLPQHIARNLIHYGAQLGWFFALTLIPIGQVVAIEFTMPIWTAILAASFLSERMTSWKIAAIVLGLVGVVAGYGTWSAFSSTTANAGNQFSAGTVTLTDNDSDAALLTLTAAKPGDFDEGCITASYSGSLPAAVKLYGSGSFTSSSSLAPYLNLTITRGSFASAPAFDSCTGFLADTGGGVLYNGTLAAFNSFYSSFGNGLVDTNNGTTEVWSNPESHVYKIRVSVQDNNSAQGLNANETFTWEAQNN
jgi:hypothetical protein